MANEITDMKFIQAFNDIVLDYYLYAFKSMDIDHDRTLRDDYNRVVELLKDEFISESNRDTTRSSVDDDAKVVVKQKILRQQSGAYTTNPLMPLYFAASRANQKEGVNPLLDILFTTEGKYQAYAFGDNKQGLEYIQNMGYLCEKGGKLIPQLTLKEFAKGYEEKIAGFLQFFSIYSFFETIPNYLLERLDIEIDNPFVIKDRYLFRIMNEYINIDLLKAKYLHKSVVLVCRNHINDHYQLFKVFPLQIRNAMNSAKQYLIGIEVHPEDERKNSLVSIRIDSIEKIIPIDLTVSKEDVAMARMLLPYIWESSVRKSITFDSLRKDGITDVKKQLNKMVEKGLMHITVLYLKKNIEVIQYLHMYLNHHHKFTYYPLENQYKVVIYHMDSIELRPFIRTLYPYLDCIQESCDPYYQNDLKNMIKAIEDEKGKKVIPIKEKKQRKIMEQVSDHINDHIYKIKKYTAQGNHYEDRIVPLQIRLDQNQQAKLIYLLIDKNRIQSIPVRYIDQYEDTNEVYSGNYQELIDLIDQYLDCNISVPLKYIKQNTHEFEVHLKYKIGKKDPDNPDLIKIRDLYPKIEIIEETSTKSVQAHYFKVKVIERKELDHLLLQLSTIDLVYVDGKIEYQKKDKHTKEFEDHMMVFNCFMNKQFYTTTHPYLSSIEKLPLSKVEVQWLKDSLNDPHSSFFFSEEEILTLQLRLELGHFLYDHLVPLTNTHKPNMNMIERFKHVYSLYLNHQSIEGYQIERMEYYQKKDDFDIIFQKDNILYHCFLSQLEMDHIEKHLKKVVDDEASVKIIFVDQKNLLDRLCNEFALYKKEISYNEEENKYYLRIYFDQSDQDEIIRRLISYGPYIHSHDGGESLIEDTLNQVQFREIKYEKHKEEVRD